LSNVPPVIRSRMLMPVILALKVIQRIELSK
jgi:hypothetical protein